MHAQALRLGSGIGNCSRIADAAVTKLLQCITGRVGIMAYPAVSSILLQDAAAVNAADGRLEPSWMDEALGVDSPSAGPVPDGERRFLTILFADLCGSTELIADIDPEDAQILMDAVARQMAEAVRSHGGTVLQFTGDGLMAVFGAPLAQEDHAGLACRAALALHRAIAGIEAPMAAGPLQARVGVHAGEVVLQHPDGGTRVYGQAPHLAARLEQHAPPGGTLVSETTARLIEDAFLTIEQSPGRFKGFARPVPLRRLQGERPVRSRLEIAIGRGGLTPLAGRRTEMEALLGALRRAKTGAGGAFTLVGEPGAGKSRLAHEVARSAGDCLCLIAYAKPHGVKTPYEPLVGMLSSYFGIAAVTDPALQQRAVSERLIALDPALADAEAPLLWLLGAATQAARRAGDAAALRRAASTAFCRVLELESRRRPVLLVMEDLQWADEGTESALEELATVAASTRILLLATCRPGHPVRWQGRPGCAELPVAPLAASDAHAMLEVLLGTDPGLLPLKQVLIRQSAGNPFFIEEIVRSLVETGALTGSPGCYAAPLQPERIEVPASIHAILAARIDRLSEAAKRVLRAAAIIGAFSGRDVLAAVVALPDSSFVRALADLDRAGLLLETATDAEPVYRFKHGLVQDVTHDGLLRDQRAALHAAALRALSRLRPGSRADLAAALARHAAGAEAWAEAVAHMHEAGTLATDRSMHRAALAFFEDALAALAKLPAQQARQEQALTLHLAARNALWTLSDHEAILGHLRSAEALATELGDRKQLGRVASFMIQHHRLAGEPDLAIAAGERAIRTATVLGDPDLLIETRFRLGMTCLTVSEYSGAIRLFEENIAELDRGRSHERIGLPGITAVLSRAWLAICLAELGQFDGAIARAREGLAIAQPVDPGYSTVSALFALANAEMMRGDAQAACQIAERGLALCERHAIAMLVPLLRFVVGCVRLDEGRPDEAIGSLEIAAELDRPTPGLARHTMFLARLGEAYLDAGRLADAKAVAATALSGARKRRERGHEACALWLAARIAAAEEAGSVAVEHAAAALNIASALGMQPLVQRIRGTALGGSIRQAI